MENLNLITHILAYDDTEAGTTNNPRRRIADWSRLFSNLSISKPKSNVFSVEPGQTLDLFSGVRATSIDGTTAFDVSLLPTGSSVYRFTRSAGTNPNFRTPRTLGADATSQITVTINNNATAQFMASGGTLVNFSPVQVGDILRIAGITTGDAAGPFAALNEGYWVVLTVTALSVTCRRLAGASFLGAAETVTLGASFATNFIAYSAAGVQLGDRMEITAGFSPVTQKTFTVSQAAPLFIEIVSAEPLPLENLVIPGISGMVFYTSAKRLVYLEVDQEAVIRVNGYTGNATRLSPFLAADPSLVASYQQVGNVYQLTIVNKSETATLNGFFFFAE